MDLYNPDCPKLPWMVEFFSSNDGKVLNNQLEAAFAETTLQHLSSLNIKSKAPVFRASQLICTISSGTTCNNIEDLIRLGMSVARIVVPAKQKEQFLEVVAKVRAIVDGYSRKVGRIYPLAFAVDVKGPEIRIGQLEKNRNSLYLEEGKITTLTTNEAYEEFVNEDMIFVDYQKLPEIIQPGDKVLLDYGALHLSAIEVAESIVRCIVEKAGTLISRSSVIVPNAPVELPSVSEDDKEILQLAIDNHIDYIIVSSIYNKENINDVKKLFGNDGAKLQVIAKIENSFAVENIDEIIKNSDAICLDFERLLYDIPKEKIFIVQKSILAKCSLEGIPAICFINISENSLSKSVVCDIANCVLDGADALLVNQSACSKDILTQITIVCKEAEPAIFQRQLFSELVFSVPTPNESIFSLCMSTVQASMKSSAAAIICLTTSGRTARILSRFKPRCPIIVITRYSRIARLLKLYRGVDPIIYLKTFSGNYDKDVEERIQLGITYGKNSGYIKMGDAVVTVTSSRPETGIPNSMRILYASDYDTFLTKVKS